MGGNNGTRPRRAEGYDINFDFDRAYRALAANIESQRINQEYATLEDIINVRSTPDSDPIVFNTQLGDIYGESGDAIVQEDSSFEQKIRLFLDGEEVDGINQEMVDAYFLEEKKKRYLDREERRSLHKPLSDGEKVTSSVSLEDLFQDVSTTQ